MEIKDLKVLDEKWDYLIILDACRYDYFEKYYKFFLSGELQKRKTAGSCTPLWRDANFPDFYEDVVYITASPMINSAGEVYGYKASEHFKHIEELWKTLWNKEIGTVEPMRAVEEAVKIIRKPEYQGKRFIIHLLQPHAPYICSGVRGFSSGDIVGGRHILESGKYKENRFCRRFYEKNRPKLRKLVFWHNQPDWVLRRIMRLSPQGAMETMWRSLGTKMLGQEYSKNLLCALSAVRCFAEQTNGTLAVTADHGELLGERGMYGHPDYSDIEVLIHVPYLLVDRENCTSETILEDDEQSVADKLNQLGYM